MMHRAAIVHIRRLLIRLLLTLSPSCIFPRLKVPCGGLNDSGMGKAIKFFAWTAEGGGCNERSTLESSRRRDSSALEEGVDVLDDEVAMLAAKRKRTAKRTIVERIIRNYQRLD